MSNLKFKANYLPLLLLSIITLISCENEVLLPLENEIAQSPINNNGDATLNTGNNTTTTSNNPTNSNNPNSEFTADAQELLKLVNQERVSRGLNPLTLNKELSDSAFKHSKDMKDNIKNLNHTGSDGSQFWERAKRDNYQGSAKGENIAWGQRTPQQVHNAWMNSPPHRANILTEGITEMGIGRDGNFWTQVFGSN